MKRRQRHNWYTTSTIQDACAACGLKRERGLKIFTYRWPDGREETRSITRGYVPPCYPEEKKP